MKSIEGSWSKKRWMKTKKKIQPVIQLLHKAKLRMVSSKLKPAIWILHRPKLHLEVNSPAHQQSNLLARLINVTNCLPWIIVQLMAPLLLWKTWCSITTNWTKTRPEWHRSSKKTRWERTTALGSPKTSPYHLTRRLGMLVPIEVITRHLTIETSSTMLKAWERMAKPDVSKLALSHGLIIMLR